MFYRVSQLFWQVRGQLSSRHRYLVAQFTWPGLNIAELGGLLYQVFHHLEFDHLHLLTAPFSHTFTIHVAES